MSEAAERLLLANTDLVSSRCEEVHHCTGPSCREADQTSPGEFVKDFEHPRAQPMGRCAQTMTRPLLLTSASNFNPPSPSRSDGRAGSGKITYRR